MRVDIQSWSSPNTIKKFITSDGLTLAAEMAGPADGPTVILLHGGGQTHHAWGGAMRHLVDDGYQVISYDARGHGESDWAPDGDYSIVRMAQDLKGVRSSVEGRVAFVGASMGGMASFYAIGSSDHPIADALVMVDITLRPAAAGAKKITDFMRGHPDGFATLEQAADAVAAYNPDRPRPSSPEGLRKKSART